MAREKAKAAGVSDRVTFAVASAKDFPGKDYDLVAFFDCLHDMGDPVGAAGHVKTTLAPGGTWMIVEPFANDEETANHNPVGRIYYSASATICVPCSLAQEVGMGLGAQAGPARLEKVARGGGFSTSARLRRRRSIWCLRLGDREVVSFPFSVSVLSRVRDVIRLS